MLAGRMPALPFWRRLFLSGLPSDASHSLFYFYLPEADVVVELALGA